MKKEDLLTNPQSGALDIIVVEQPNKELQCSAFHIRFGCLHATTGGLRVTIEVNGNVVKGVNMWVGT